MKIRYHLKINATINSTLDYRLCLQHETAAIFEAGPRILYQPCRWRHHTIGVMAGGQFRAQAWVELGWQGELNPHRLAALLIGCPSNNRTGSTPDYSSNTGETDYRPRNTRGRRLTHDSQLATMSFRRNPP